MKDSKEQNKELVRHDEEIETTMLIALITTTFVICKSLPKLAKTKTTKRYTIALSFSYRKRKK